MADDRQDSRPVIPSRGFMRQCKRFVDGYGGGPPRGGVRSPYPNWNPGNQRAASTGLIAGGTFHAPGSGSARLFYLVDGAWTQADEDVTVYHDLSDEDIAENTVLRLSWIAGQWWVSEAGCTAETSPIVDAGGA